MLTPSITRQGLGCFVCGLLLLAALVFLFPSTAAAIPVSDYHKNLQRAITALDTLVQSDEEEGVSDYERRLGETINAIRGALPEYQPVQSGEEICSVDNAWLHKDLDEIGKLPPEERSVKISRVLETLKALEERVAELQKPTTVGDSKAAAKKKLAGILSRSEYSAVSRGPNALTRLAQDFLRWLQRFFPKLPPVEPGRTSTISLIAQIMVIALALAVLLYVGKILLTRLKGSRTKRAPKERKPRIVLGERLEADDTATDLLSEAEALARGGDLRAAIRKAYIALLVELGDRKMISLAQHKTNRDYLRAVSKVPLLHSRMSGLTDSFERHWYGFAQATQNDWQNFRDGYQAALQTRN